MKTRFTPRIASMATTAAGFITGATSGYMLGQGSVPKPPESVTDHEAQLSHSFAELIKANKFGAPGITTSVEIEAPSSRIDAENPGPEYAKIYSYRYQRAGELGVPLPFAPDKEGNLHVALMLKAPPPGSKSLGLSTFEGLNTGGGWVTTAAPGPDRTEHSTSGLGTRVATTKYASNDFGLNIAPEDWKVLQQTDGVEYEPQLGIATNRVIYGTQIDPKKLPQEKLDSKGLPILDGKHKAYWVKISSMQEKTDEVDRSVAEVDGKVFSLGKNVHQLSLYANKQFEEGRPIGLDSPMPMTRTEMTIAQRVLEERNAKEDKQSITR